MADDDKTFTQAEVDAIVRERLKRERDATATKYADYDELKDKAADADKSKTQLDKLSEQIGALTGRAEKAEAAQLRSSVIATKLKGVPASLTKRLQGKTEEELNADADELLADWKAAGGKTAEGEGDADQDGSEGKTQARQAAPVRVTGRPREELRSGAPVTAREPEETNPMKLAALIPRN